MDFHTITEESVNSMTIIDISDLDFDSISALNTIVRDRLWLFTREPMIWVGNRSI